MSDSEQPNEEYANAKKLVVRAANRESLLEKPSETSGTGADFSNLILKADHHMRPCWTCPDGTIYLEAFHSLYKSAYDFLVAIADPVARPEFLHEYKLTPYSLYAAVATNIGTESIIKVLDRLSKNVLPTGVAKFIRECTKRYGKAKLVLKHNKFYVESEYPAVLRDLLRDPQISQSRVYEETATSASGEVNADGSTDTDGFVVNEKAAEMEEVSSVQFRRRSLARLFDLMFDVIDKSINFVICYFPCSDCTICTLDLRCFIANIIIANYRISKFFELPTVMMIRTKTRIYSHLK